LNWPKNGKPFAAPSGVKSILVKSDEAGEARLSNYITEPSGQRSTLAQKGAQGRPADRRPNELELFNPVPRGIETRIEATGSQWTIDAPDGQQMPVPTTGIPVSLGETIVVSVKDGTHGLTFRDRDLAERFFHFEIGGSPFNPQPTFGKTAIGTPGLGSGTVLAVLTVRKDVPVGDKLNFVCTVQGQRMAATFVVAK
jgi:hypothetical protein